MKKLTDEELDSIFKTAAEGLKPPFDVSEWEAMSAKLNAPTPTLFNRWLLLSFLGVIIFSAGVWVGSSLNGDSKNAEATFVNTIPGNGEADQSNLQLKDGSLKQQQELVKSSDSESLVSPSDNMDEKNNPNRNSKLKQVVINNQVPARNESIQPDLVRNERVVDIENEEKQMPLLNSEQLPYDSKLKISANELPQDSSQVVYVKLSKTDSVEATEADEDIKESTFAKGIFLRGLASPDFSAIDFGSTTSVGTNYALMVEYQFASRWSASTGVIRSLKKYGSNKEITYSGYTADKLDGTCRILDIPINVYYQIRPHSKTSFFAGAGLSSYIMLSEDYTYTVFTNYGDRYYSTAVKKKNNEWFKVLNLSMGIQHRFGSRMYLQAEPFIKAPLAGIGEGDVLLSSLGVFFGLKYKIN